MILELIPCSILCKTSSKTKEKIYWAPVDTGRKLNVHKMFRRLPGHLLTILWTFSLRPVSTGVELLKLLVKYYFVTLKQCHLPNVSILVVRNFGGVPFLIKDWKQSSHNKIFGRSFDVSLLLGYSTVKYEEAFLYSIILNLLISTI